MSETKIFFRKTTFLSSQIFGFISFILASIGINNDYVTKTNNLVFFSNIPEGIIAAILAFLIPWLIYFVLIKIFEKRDNK